MLFMKVIHYQGVGPVSHSSYLGLQHRLVDKRRSCKENSVFNVFINEESVLITHTMLIKDLLE